MEIKKLTEMLSVSSQLNEWDLQQIRQLGFKSIICNRPDGESIEQTPFQLIDRQARIVDIKCYYLPVASGNITQPEANAFLDLLEQAEKPVLAYCRTGSRCTALWELAIQ
ncbi:TIGR01244 family sulfur transferase [Alteromonas ponticola]|uniref:TIGR01244 family sulfur transferase n=1 Tax=Alteromonas aquimaris TaxID=2998417 RepID=A0ABT3P2C6_9ALTE|nr:TIGR01244 family sulfur transferase [Alteromonas aquimaris]MCW8106912.1 TIGR01244 family sulfur transferase [Alteromonas aquimaris]